MTIAQVRIAEEMHRLVQQGVLSKVEKGFDRPFEGVEEALRVGWVLLQSERLDEFYHSKSHRCWGSVDEVVVTAVDATPKRWYTMLLVEGEWLVETEGLLTEAHDITFVEALAMSMGLHQHRSAKVIAVLGDNTGALASSHKGYSSSPGIDKLIAALEDATQVRIIVDVVSAENIADVGREERAARSRTSMKRAREALRSYDERGSTYSGRLDIANEEEEGERVENDLSIENRGCWEDSINR